MKQVLFVCIENAARSQMAEALFNQLAKGRARASSAGIKLAKEVDPLAVQVMREIGIDISKQKPEALTFGHRAKVEKLIEEIKSNKEEK